MSDPEALFATFLKGETSFDALDDAVARILDDAPQRAGEIAVALEAAKDRGLPLRVYAALRGQLETVPATQPPGGAHPPAEEAHARDDHATGHAPSPRPGSVADNAGRLGEDREATERTLLTYLGTDGTAPEDAGADEPAPAASGDRPDAPDITRLAEVSPGVDGEFTPGYVLRGRFQLIRQLGEGGMGSVWRARDMLKVRARDRNPFVAIKLLSEDFREHPQAFISLQRETSKQQRLAHPNVATVFDFDRDQDTNTVFMTMEVMEGESLDVFIRKLPPGGLSEKEAMPIIEQLGAGLSYAHQNGLVHSDLKPGNCFITTGGVVKLLDFGIARASKTEAHEQGEKTLFDPGKFGAITPSHATVEMFEGKDPDPRDDIYALAIMAYQLFTGKHPFGRQNAVKAMTLELPVPYVARLSKRQNRALARGLAFRREGRTATVEEFLEGLRPVRSRNAAFIAAGAAALVLIGVLAYRPLIGLLESSENSAIVEQMQSGDLADIRPALARIRALADPERRRAVLDDPRAVGALTAALERSQGDAVEELLILTADVHPGWRQDFFAREAVRRILLDKFGAEIDAAFDPAAGRHDYAEAAEKIRRLDALYPNSAAVLGIKNTVEEKRSQRLQALARDFERLLAEGALVPAEDQEDVSDVLGALETLAPDHPLLADERLRITAVTLAERALEAGDVDAARRYVEAGFAYAPSDASLEALGRRIAGLAAQAQEARVAAGLIERLETAPADKLEDFTTIGRDLLTLRVLDPDNVLGWTLKQRHLELFEESFRTRLSGGQADAARALLESHAPLLDVDYLDAARTRLAGAGDDDGKDALAAGLESLAARIAGAEASVAWTTEMVAGSRRLAAQAPAGEPRLARLRADAAEVLAAEAEAAIRQEHFDAARRWLARARMISPSAPRVESASRALQSALAAEKEREQRANARAELGRLKAAFAATLADGRPADADVLLARIRELHADAPRGDADGTAFLAGAYADLAEAHARQENFDAAVKAASAGLALKGASQPLREAFERYRATVDRRALLATLRARLDGLEPLDVAAVRRDLKALEAKSPGDFSTLVTDLASRRSAAITAYVAAGELDANVLAARLEEFSQAFPGASDALGQAVAERALERVKAEIKRDPVAARSLLDALLRAIPDAAGLKKLARSAPPVPLLEAHKLIVEGRLSRASAILDANAETLGDRPEFNALKRSLALKRQQATEKYQHFVTQAKTGSLSTREHRLAAFNEVKALWSDNPDFERVDYVNRTPGACFPDLAGEGVRDDGSCFDFIDEKVKGPLMVVIPGDGELPPVAVGKYEVSVAEFNRFCQAAGACDPIRGRSDKEPVTGVSLEDAKNYAQWLSRAASARSPGKVVYRLPSEQEWRRAAWADGAPATRSINCRPESGSSLAAGVLTSQGGTLSLGVPIGRSLVSASFGEENGYGVVNAVGNAREWTLSPGGPVARGGAFSDPAADCGIDARSPHDGSADPLTGFRLVRELD